jgi:hypothetical protein
MKSKYVIVGVWKEMCEDQTFKNKQKKKCHYKLTL